jgi:HSP20 family molecular chaperone IbpA
MALGAFCCPVKPDEVKVNYETGLLDIGVPFRNLTENAVKVLEA